MAPDAPPNVTYRDAASLPSALGAWAEISERVGSRPLVVFLDFDGTLSPIVDDPAAAALPPATRSAIAHLADVVPITIVSGRGADDVRARVGLDTVHVAGSHGFEVIGPDGVRHDNPEAAPALPGIEAASTELASALADTPGAIVEQKRFGLTVHDRMVADEQVDEVRRLASEAGARHGLRVTHGKRVTELRPPVDWHKGRAVLWLLERLDLDEAAVVYIGDDRTDEDAFTSLGDTAVNVVVADPSTDRGRETAAAYRVGDPDEVRVLLERLAALAPTTERAPHTGDMDPDPTGARLVIVANRLPVRWSEDEQRWVQSPGGLVSAVGPAVANVDRAAWIGWTGSEVHEEPFEQDSLQLHPVAMSAQEKIDFYDGMSNGTLWPLYHDKVVPSEFHRHWFETYRRINRRYAEAAADTAGRGATVWVHDYQLSLVPGMLRELRPDLTIGYFLHIPFPPPEVFIALPWRNEIAKGMLGADLVGFQTPDAADNFHRLAIRCGLADDGRAHFLRYRDRDVRTGAYPIGIDVARYEDAARDSATSERARDLRARLGAPHTVLLGVDRLDYTKGIDVRLRALKELLDQGDLDPAHVTMVQVAQPSRDDVEAYITLREEVDRLIGEINGDHARVGFPVVHYLHQDVDFVELIAMYRAADVMVVTPFRDGMNLVAKEYVAARYDLTGSLVLSEFAGAATELADALLVNPYDIDGLKLAITQAVSMDHAEARRRMERMRAAVLANDASGWAHRFLEDMPDR